MLWQRALTAIIGIPLGLLIVYLGGWWLASAVALLALLGLAELYRLTAARSLKAYVWLGYPLALLSVALPALRPANSTSWQIELPVLCLGLLALLVWAVILFPGESGGRLLATIVGVGYVAHLLSYLLRLRALAAPPLHLGRSGVLLDFGALSLAGVLVISWGMDTAAYAIGKTIGRHKLCPNLSPGKTIEGALAALLAATLLGMGLFACLPGSAGVSPAFLAQGALFGAILGIAGQLGDLFESLLKRRAGVKDSGALLPGHGGVLDRFDSLLFNAPAAFFYLRITLGL
jgi:phosphatidate cytidylyltransferase